MSATIVFKNSFNPFLMGISTGIMISHDIPHCTTDRTVKQMLELNWENVDHPPYNPDPSPSGYHLFMHLKYRSDLKMMMNCRQTFMNV